jgi:uncharacterized protein (DUF1330 family)
MAIDPTPVQLAAFGATTDRPEPVVMLNLLRFAPGTGAEAYGRYAAAVAEHLERVGGSLLWAGACDDPLIGPEAREWDAVAIVSYPSRAAFIEMVSDPAYLEIARDRSAGLADSRLIPCTPAAPAAEALRTGAR